MVPEPLLQGGQLVRRSRVGDEHAHRLVRCLDLFDAIEAYRPSGILRDQMVRACRLGHGRHREAALRVLLARIERTIGEALR